MYLFNRSVRVMAMLIDKWELCIGMLSPQTFFGISNVLRYLCLLGNVPDFLLKNTTVEKIFVC